MASQISSDNLMRIISDKNIMKLRGLSFWSAIDAGLSPSAYSFTGLPTGKMLLRLDFKVWNKSASLGLYFTDPKKNIPYRLTAFKNKGRDIYSDSAGMVDFSQPNINGSIYEVEIARTKSGNFSLKSAKLSVDNSYLTI